VELTWSEAQDCDGGAVAGYHLYRRSAADQSYTRVSAAPLATLSYADAGVAGAPAGSVYYYALAAVDSAGDESVKSAPAAVTIPQAAGSSSAEGGGGGGGCFVETVVNEGSHEHAGATGIAWAVTLLWIAVLHAGTNTRYTVLK
jgi:hypothetical protein